MIGIICSHNRIQPIAYKFRPFLNSEVKNANEALQGARDIISEWVNERLSARTKTRILFKRDAIISSKLSKKDKAQVLANNEAIAKKNCKAAQLNEKMLNSLDKVMITDANGKSRTLTEKERKEQLSISKEHISLYCVN